MAREFDRILADATGAPMPGQQPDQQPTTSLPEGSLGTALAPVLQVEKTDAMFWLAVFQTVLLFLIWLNTRR